RGRLLRGAGLILAGLVIPATVLIKQHSVAGAAAGVILAIAAWFALAYTRQYLTRSASSPQRKRLHRVSSRRLSAPPGLLPFSGVAHPRQSGERGRGPRPAWGGSRGVRGGCHSSGSSCSACPGPGATPVGPPPARIRRHEPGPQPSRFSTMPRVLGDTRWPFS